MAANHLQVAPNPSSSEENVAECLILLSQSNGRDGLSNTNISNSGTAAPTSSSNNNKNETAIQESQGYKCNICNKWFKKKQALGGHKTGHYKRPRKNISESVSTSSTIVSASVPPPNPNGDKAHICTICNKSFDKGQALGGHKRLHYKKPVPDNNGSGHNDVSADASKEQNMVGTDEFSPEMKHDDKAIVHDFDLNLPPEPEPEETVGLNLDSEVNKICDGNKVEQDSLPLKKRRLALNPDLHLLFVHN